MLLVSDERTRKRFIGVALKDVSQAQKHRIKIEDCNGAIAGWVTRSFGKIS